MERVLNRSETEAQGSEPKDLPSSLLTDVQRALEPDHSGCDLGKACVCVRARVSSFPNFQQALLFPCVVAYQSFFFVHVLMTAQPPPASTPLRFLPSLLRHSQSILGCCLSPNAVEFFARRVGVPSKRRRIPSRLPSFFLFHPLKHTHTHASSLCLHARQSK